MSLFEESDPEFEKAFQKALFLLDYAPQTAKMINDKLYKKGFNKEIIDKVINKLNDQNLLNDIEYACVFAENLVKYKFLGPGKILMKLNLKGINRQDAKEITDKVIRQAGGEEEILKNYITKNKIQVKRLLDKNQKDKIQTKLFNNGFSVDLIYRSIKKIEELVNN